MTYVAFPGVEKRHSFIVHVKMTEGRLEEEGERLVVALPW